MKFAAGICSILAIILVGCRQPLFVATGVSVDTPIQANVNAHLGAPERSPLIEVQITGCQRHCCPAKVALIDVDSLIVNTNLSGPYVSGENPVALFHEKVSKAAADPQVCAIVLRINSPGGGVAATELMRRQIMKVRQRRRVPVVACLMDVAAGGAYYLASSCDAIYAQHGTITGGIGVVLNLYNLSDLMAQLPIVSNTIKAGDKVDLGTPLQELSSESEALLQEMADEFHERFKQDVIASRRLDYDASASLFDGRVFTAQQAVENGLIDRVGSLETAIEAASKLALQPNATVVMYRRMDDPAYSIYATTPQVPLQASFSLPSIPGLDRSRLPSFLYMWQPEPTVERLIGR